MSMEQTIPLGEIQGKSCRAKVLLRTTVTESNGKEEVRSRVEVHLPEDDRILYITLPGEDALLLNDQTQKLLIMLAQELLDGHDEFLNTGD